MDYYKILGIPPGSDKMAIKKAYRSMSKKYHPDLYDGDKKYAEEMMKRINQAYAVLYKGEEIFDDIEEVYDDNTEESSGSQSAGPSEKEKKAAGFTNDEPSKEQKTNKTAHYYRAPSGNGMFFWEKPPWFLSVPIILVLFFIFPPVGEIISVLLFLLRYLIFITEEEIRGRSNAAAICMAVVLFIVFNNPDVENIRNFRNYLFGWTGLFGQEQSETTSESHYQTSEAVSTTAAHTTASVHTTPPPQTSTASVHTTSPPQTSTAPPGSSAAVPEATAAQTTAPQKPVIESEPVYAEPEETGELYYDETNDYYYYA